MPEIKVANLTLKYINKKQETSAIKDLSADFFDGLINVIIGGSGAGKTSLIKCIIGLLDYEGTITMDGANLEDISFKEKNFSYVSQDIALYPHLSIFRNIAFPLTLTSATTEEIRERVLEVSKMLGIEDLLFRKPRQISIGQAQRVAIARAIIKRPSVYFFDEQFSNLDSQTASRLRIDLKKILKELNATAFIVTHDIPEALSLADKLFVMEDGQIICSGEPNTVYKSEDPRVKEFFKSLNYESI